jgi:hypothetical protein
MSEPELHPPEKRECERCGRRDRWDGAAGHWAVAEEGDPFCIHEWDVTGTYNPLAAGDE